MQANIATDRSRRLCAWGPRALGFPVLMGLLMGLGLATQSGCTVFQNARRTLIQEPSEFSWRWDRGRSLKVYRQWADQAWAAESGACPEAGAVDEYALGFRDGFVDFVYAGGDGQPPPVPPRKFWNVAWRTPEGDVAAQQWFAGYRHGAQSARNGGYRQSGIVNSSYRTDLAAGSWTSAAPPTMVDSASPLGPPIETLPTPPEAPAPSDGESLPAPPKPRTDERGPTSAEPFQDMLPPEGEPAGGLPAEAAPRSEAPSRDAPGDGAVPENDEPPVFEIPTGEVHPTAAVVPAHHGAQRFRRAVTKFRNTAPGATP
jgi:hypothetical protein